MQNTSTLSSWILAFRLQTLIASISPVMIGTAFAWKFKVFHPLVFLFTLVFSILIQIGTNLANDYFDFVKGTDTEKRKGPTRACLAGLILPIQMKRAFILLFSLAFLSSLYLIWEGGMVFFFLVVLSIAFGILYTAGPKPLGYIGLGDLLVFIFFGPVATIGTFYLQTHFLHPSVWVASLAPGMLSVAILTVNNLRDRKEDKQVNKNTLVVLLGKKWGQFEYLLCMLVAFFVPLILFMQNHSPRILLTWGVFSFAAFLVYEVFQNKEPQKLNAVLKKTALFLMLYSFTFSLAVL